MSVARCSGTENRKRNSGNRNSFGRSVKALWSYHYQQCSMKRELDKWKSFKFIFWQENVCSIFRFIWIQLFQSDRGDHHGEGGWAPGGQRAPRREGQRVQRPQGQRLQRAHQLPPPWHCQWVCRHQPDPLLPLPLPDSHTKLSVALEVQKVIPFSFSVPYSPLPSYQHNQHHDDSRQSTDTGAGAAGAASTVRKKIDQIISKDIISWIMHVTCGETPRSYFCLTCCFRDRTSRIFSSLVIEYGYLSRIWGKSEILLTWTGGRPMIINWFEVLTDQSL